MKNHSYYITIITNNKKERNTFACVIELFFFYINKKMPALFALGGFVVHGPGLCLRARGWEFHSATWSINPGYFHRKTMLTADKV